MSIGGDVKGSIDSYVKGLGFGPGGSPDIGGLGDRTDPTDALRAKYGWLSGQLERLQKPLAQVEGKPDLIRAYAKVWNDIAATTGDAGRALASETESIGGWDGRSGEAYRLYMTAQTRRLNELESGAAAMSEVATAGAGTVAEFRLEMLDVVRRACFKLAEKIPKWLAKHGGDKAVVIGLAAVAIGVTVALLIKLLRKLRQIIDALKALLGKVVSWMKGLGGGGGGGDGERDPSKLGPSRPTLPPDENRKPGGKMYNIKPGMRSELGTNLRIQEMVMEDAAKAGYEAEHWNKPNPHLDEDKEADGRIAGNNYWDVYATRSNSGRNILENIREKARTQAESIVLAFPKYPEDPRYDPKRPIEFNREREQMFLKELHEAVAKGAKLPGVREIKIYRDHQFYDVYP